VHMCEAYDAPVHLVVGMVYEMLRCFVIVRMRGKQDWQKPDDDFLEKGERGIGIRNMVSCRIHQDKPDGAGRSILGHSIAEQPNRVAHQVSGTTIYRSVSQAGTNCPATLQMAC